MSVAKVEAFVKGTPLEGRILVSEESSATVALAAEAFHTEPDQIAKTLSFLLDENTPIVVVASGLARIDNKKYKGRFQKKASMIPPEKVEEYTGYAPGGVCPFALKEGVRVFLDVSLKKYEKVYPAAGSSNSALPCTLEELETYSSFEEWVDVTKE
ncbi:MAG: YbaK/EbsC family protein [Blautia sp.]|nr:YbaK/EbsC family protein [Blautia sp.]